jgi:hypothetical protein
MRALLDRTVVWLATRLRLSFANFAVLTVLHVERLHDDKSFAAVLEFCGDYLRASGQRVVATVVPPVAPILAEELAQLGVDHELYAARIGELAKVADVGLHGHYLRGASATDGPLHHYWQELEPQAQQMAREIEWLESRGFMDAGRRVYAAGWWYMSDRVRALLRHHRFRHDFTASTNPYNLSLRSAGARNAAEPAFPAAATPTETLAIAGVCATRGASHVPRYLLRMFWREWLLRRPVTVSLYGHDWDMVPAGARATLRDLQALRVALVGLDALERAA